jgi:hypothetical protein
VTWTRTPALSKGSDRHWRYPRPSKFLAAREGAGHAFDRAWFGAVTAAGWICTEHDRFMTTVEVKGIVNAEKPCTAACRAATGPNCECVCGGDGHGANFG